MVFNWLKQRSIESGQEVNVLYKLSEQVKRIENVNENEEKSLIKSNLKQIKNSNETPNDFELIKLNLTNRTKCLQKWSEYKSCLSNQKLVIGSLSMIPTFLTYQISSAYNKKQLIPNRLNVVIPVLTIFFISLTQALLTTHNNCSEIIFYDSNSVISEKARNELKKLNPNHSKLIEYEKRKKFETQSQLIQT